MPLPEPPPCGGGGCQDEDIFILLEFFSVCVTSFFCSALFSLASFSSLKRKAISFAMAPSFDPIEAKMRAAGLSDAAVSAFKLNFDALAGGESGMVRKEEDERRRTIEDEEFHGDRGAPWLLLRAAALFEASFRSSSCSRITLICRLLTRSSRRNKTGSKSGGKRRRNSSK